MRSPELDATRSGARGAPAGVTIPAPPDPVTGTDEAVRRLRLSGYAWLRGLLADRVEALAAAVDEAFAEHDRTYGVTALQEIGERGLVRNLGAYGATFLDLLLVPEVDAVVRAVMPGESVLNCFDALALFPGEGRYPWDYHTDLMELRGAAFPADVVPAVNVLFFVSRVREDNGATWIVPGSHRSVVTQPPAELLAELSEPIEAEPGDVLLFDARLWHCAGTNPSDTTRVVVKALFTRPWFRPQMDFTRAVPESLLDGRDARLRELLGYRAVPPVSVPELRERRARAQAT